MPPISTSSTSTSSAMIEREADYLIVGSGAIGMAFADVIVSESDATVIIVDQFDKPGGHWNVAYPFVKLHQPASFYGVSSVELSTGEHERGGLNNGLAEMSSGPAVSAYYDDVMRHRFLPTGRVQYFPLHTYEGDGVFVSHVTGQRYHATATKKTVDATHLKANVPSTHTPNFSVADGVRFMALNDLPSLTDAPDGFVVIGAGKTGVDACLWLLEHGVDPDAVTWVVSREAWLLDRKNTQMTEPFFFDTLGAQAAMMESIVDAEDKADMFERLEACGYFCRVAEAVTPTMFHGATVSRAEIDALRTITNVVRLGHVTSIGVDEIEFDYGSIATTANTVHVDCSARAVTNTEIKTVFDGDLITPQMVRPYQPVFSAAVIAYVELHYDTDAERNALCGVVPLPNTTDDFITFTLAALMNQYAWSQDRPLRKWIAANRLDGASKLIKTIASGDTEKLDVMNRIKTAAPLAAAKLFEFQAEIDAQEA